MSTKGEHYLFCIIKKKVRLGGAATAVVLQPSGNL